GLKNIFVPLCCAVLSVFSGCIKNDIPYPRIQANIRAFDVAGSFKAAEIDSTEMTVNVYLEENVNIRSVMVDSFALTPESHFVDFDPALPVDLSEPKKVTVALYQDYAWTITANQPIERYFTVANQIGSSEIDVPAHRVIAYVSSNADVSALNVLSIKLWPEGATVETNLLDGPVDFSRPVEVKVEQFGVKETWYIYIESRQASVTTVSADGWTCVGWVYGEAEEDRDNGVEYRKDSDTEWTRAPKEWITTNGGSFTCRLVHLEPLTTYHVRAYSNEEYGSELSFTTGVTLQVPNTDFNNWWLNGKVWNPWAEGADPFWDSGNKGATTLGTSNTYPSDDTPTGSGKSACLETRFVGIGAIGKLAAGNIFTGYYVATDGTNGILSFGREFTERPTKLRGYFKYKSTTISNSTAGSGYEYLKGRPDTCNIWCALSDKGEPYIIRTNPKNLQLFSPNDPSVIAYGNFQLGESVNSYREFEIKFNYNATNRIPTHIVIVASASKYGDFFTGGSGSVLYVDDFELLYDYDD
ncbi:MAG: PCMD domain-containing protein, partial [Muribaculaceae bacterium]|nr:PCMD domain-containing protein [Muribaculaceae bacterium]